MRIACRTILGASLLFSTAVWSQNVKIVIPAGTPADKELTSIAAETDAQKRISLYQDFVTKYADDKPAAAYADWQLSQQYLSTGDTGKALEYGDKALELFPNDLDILVSQISVAQAMKDSGKVVDYAVQGGEIYDSIAKQPKPSDVSDDDWKTHVAEEQQSAKPSYDFCESAAYNAIAVEQDPSKRMSYIEKFTPAFPKSAFDDQISQLALYSLQQLNQPQRLETYGEKALTANPESIPTLLMLANAYAEDPKQATKAITYADKVISLTGSSTDREEATGRGCGALYRWVCVSERGQAGFRSSRAEDGRQPLPADPKAEQEALFRLGYAYAKQNRRADSMAALQKAAAIDGPYQAPAKEMLAKVSKVGK